MTALQDVFIISGTRTAVGSFGGSLKDVPITTLGKTVIAEAIRRAGITPDAVQHVVMGNVIPNEPKDAYLSRVCAVEAGIPVQAPAMTLNRLCGSGAQAIVSMAQMLQLGECDVGVAAGAENMSRAPYWATGVRWGTKMGDTSLIDAMLAALHDPFENIHMGVTAENVAEQCSISREQQDSLAAESHRRAAKAAAEGYFKEQITPIEIKTRKGVTVFDTDEHFRTDTTVESLATLKPVFKKDGTVTAGNASGINDGAAAVVLASGKAVGEQGLKPLARIVAWGHAGVEPRIMGLGPVEAVPIALARAGLTLDQIDVIESNEAFAAQACGVAQQLGFDPAKVNPNGSGISLGHPIGATGVVITVKCLYELQRTGGRYGLISMCIGGGQGIAIVIERV